MAPIPVHSSSPINTNNPSHPVGGSPSTAAARYQPAVDKVDPTTTEATRTSQPAPPPARPGAPAVPQPTNAVSSGYNHRYQPTATVPLPTGTTDAADNPPPPQPGAVPSPYTNASPRLTIPQPPRPGDNPNFTSSITSPVRHALPSPMSARAMPLPAHQQTASLYDPTRSVPPAGLTSSQPHDLSHPPGYIQDSRSSFEDKPVESCQTYERRASPTSSHRRGLLDGEPTFEHGEGNETNVLNTAVAWAKAASNRLSRTEEQIWRAINGEGKG